MSWTLQRDRSRNVVAVAFDGRLTRDDGEASAIEFSKALADGPSDVEWDLRTMTGYDSGARSAWQKHLWSVRSNIRNVRVIGGNTLVRLGATTLGLALGIPVSFADEDAR